MSLSLASSFRSGPPDPSWILDRPPDDLVIVRKADSMESKSDQRESATPLLALADARAARREFAARVTEMVADQRPKLGKLELAQRLVGRWVGLSATTVRRIIRGDSIKLEVETLSACDKAWGDHLTRIERRALLIVEAAERRRRDSDARLARARCPGSGDPGLDRQPVADPSRGAGAPERRP